MANLNKVMLIGRLGQAPEKRTTPTGKSIVKVSLATNEVFNDRSGEKKERTEWHRLVFWERLAEIVSSYCNKGSMIYIEGSLRNNEWQDKEGNKRSITEISVSNMQMLDSRGSRQSSESRSAESYQGPNIYEQKNSNDNDQSEYTDDDIPF